MAKFLQQLLGSKEPDFTLGIRRMEASVLTHNVDTRLIADITHKSHEAMRYLGLDTADSTAHEVYGSLLARADDKTLQDMLLADDYVLIALDDGIVSFNIIDIIENAHHQLDFAHRIISHAQRSLRGELFDRYLQASVLPEPDLREIAEGAGIVNVAHKDYARAQTYIRDAKGPYILAIGDIFTDAFIELDPKVASTYTDDDKKAHLVLPFGSKPPYIGSDIVTSVGPSPNAAVGFARLGLQVGLRAFLGGDQTATDSVAYLHSQGVDTSLLSIDETQRSNYYYVLRLGADRTILVKNEKYTYDWKTPDTTPDWIYLSLISDDSWKLHEDLLAYLADHPNTKLAFQPGTFHFKWGTDKLKDVYARSYIVVMNREEAVDVTGGNYDDLRGLANNLHELGPQVVVITDGPQGSYASFDGTFLRIPNYPDPAPPLDRTGAGDAFASTIVAALALGESLETALTWAPINSMSVVQHLGAQAGLLDRESIQSYIKTAPQDYRAEEYQG